MGNVGAASGLVECVYASHERAGGHGAGWVVAGPPSRSAGGRSVCGWHGRRAPNVGERGPDSHEPADDVRGGSAQHVPSAQAFRRWRAPGNHASLATALSSATAWLLRRLSSRPFTTAVCQVRLDRPPGGLRQGGARVPCNWNRCLPRPCTELNLDAGNAASPVGCIWSRAVEPSTLQLPLPPHPCPVASPSPFASLASRRCPAGPAVRALHPALGGTCLNAHRVLANRLGTCAGGSSWCSSSLVAWTASIA